MTKKRNYGIDLLRLVSMLMVVILHVLGQGGVLRSTAVPSVSNEVYWALEVLSYGAVNIYAIISGYVGYNRKHRASNLIYLCWQLMFYCVAVSAVCIIINAANNLPITFEYIIKNLFAGATDYWYFRAYFCLYFLMPLLDKIVDAAPKRTLKITAVLCLLVFCVWNGMITAGTASLAGGYSVLWLAILYVVGAYIVKYNSFAGLKAWHCFTVFLSSVAVTVITRVIIHVVSKAIYGTANPGNILISYISPTIVIGAIFLVCGFAKLNLNEAACKGIGFLSPLAFGVYLCHCHPAIYSRMHDKFAWISGEPLALGVLLVLGISVAIFLACILIDLVRLLLFKACRVKRLSDAMENGLNKAMDFIFKS